MTSEADGEPTYEFAMRIALTLLESRARSEAELTRGLGRKGVPPELAAQVIERLGELGYVDDQALAQSLAANRVQVSRRGRTRIRQELRSKGLDADVVEEALATVDPEDEWAAARALAARKARTLSGLERHVALRRLQGMLARRGFSPDICWSVSKEALGGPDTDDGLVFSTGGL